MTRDPIKPELIASFPVVDGIEIRSFGESMRTLRLYTQSVGRSSVVEKMLIVDDENKLFQVVPDVTSLSIDFKPGKIYISGRIIRLTTDIITRAVCGDHEFKKGYMRNIDCGSARLVSEPFFLLSSEAVDAAKFEEYTERAKMGFDKFNAHSTCCQD